MRKNRLFILGIFTVMVALVSLSLVSGTWAKYTSTVSGSDSARVAKWEWTYNSADVLTSFEFDLFNTTYTDSNVDVNGKNDDAVVIAPGTTGSFTFGFKNESEVNAEYSVTFTETNANNIPVQFSLDGTTWKDSLAELNIAETAIDMGDDAECTVRWRWVFEGTESGAHAGQTDSTDTELGINGEYTYGVSATVTFTQVD